MMHKPVNFMLGDLEPILNAPIKAATQEFKIQESEIQVSVILQSKMQEPTIPMVQVSNEGSRIQEHSKV